MCCKVNSRFTQDVEISAEQRKEQPITSVCCEQPDLYSFSKADANAHQEGRRVDFPIHRVILCALMVENPETYCRERRNT